MPANLRRLAAPGLGALGALRAAIEGSARAAGMRAGTGRITVGAIANLVLLSADPLSDFRVGSRSAAVMAGGTLTSRPAG